MGGDGLKKKKTQEKRRKKKPLEVNSAAKTLPFMLPRSPFHLPLCLRKMRMRRVRKKASVYVRRRGGGG